VTPSARQARERDAMGRLSRVAGPFEVRAAALALALQPSTQEAVNAWIAETSDSERAEALFHDVRAVPEGARLPALEVMLARLRLQPKPERRLLLESARRVMAVHAPLRPIDRLHWLLMRRRLGDRPPVAAGPEPHNDVSQLTAPMLLHVARVTAYLSRMVPGGDAGASQAWYLAAMSSLLPKEMVPHRQPPDGEGFAQSLDAIEALPWMLRPVIVRAWVDAAIATSLRARLPMGAADALRLVAGLLESPMPPDLERHYDELDWTC
jgi:hypothetical protein